MVLPKAALHKFKSLIKFMPPSAIPYRWLQQQNNFERMFVQWKNKGLLVLFYFIVCIIGTAALVAYLHRNVGGIFSKIDIYTGFGFSFLFASVWTYLTKDDYYLDNEGNKKKLDIQNELFWMSMQTWSIIYLVLSIVFFGNLLFKYFPPESA